MENDKIEYDISIEGLRIEVDDKLAYSDCLMSRTQLLFYFPCVLTIAIVVYLMKV